MTNFTKFKNKFITFPVLYKLKRQIKHINHTYHLFYEISWYNLF